MQERLKQIKEHYPELDIITINHDTDHIHILAVIALRMSVSEVVRIIKSNTSKDIKKKFSFLKDVPDLNPIEPKWFQAKSRRRKYNCNIDTLFEKYMA